MAMWSCAPPRVPTPVSPANGPHAAPLSTAAQYCANASSPAGAACHSGVSHSPFASNSAIVSDTTSALELLNPIDGGMELPSVTSTPVRTAGKSRVTRRATAAWYTDQRVLVRADDGLSATSACSFRPRSWTRSTGSAMHSDLACIWNGVAHVSERPPA